MQPLTDPDEIARRSAEAMLGEDRASAAAGIELVDVSPGRATVTMTVRDDMVNGHDIAHGGYVFLLADTRVRGRLQQLRPEHRRGRLRHRLRRGGPARVTSSPPSPRSGTGPAAAGSTTCRSAGPTAPWWRSCAAAAARSPGTLVPLEEQS